MEKMGDLTANFSRHEFACKCGCGLDNINPVIVAMCQDLREAMGEPIRINSGCRCPARNKAAGSTSTNHVNGNAADLSCKSGHAALYKKAKEIYAKGKLRGLDLCLLEGAWVHIDCNGKRRNGVFQTL
ncbi:hypothetical protein FACS1894187_06280 [Synergistales bacterium]|nr:hypothetical protein FACS1894187_06280 [Synergistales bacterium]